MKRAAPDPELLGRIAGSRPVVEVRALDPGYPDHGSDVWLVRTEAQELIVRSSRLREEPDREFWWGLKALFGVDPRNMDHVEAALKLLSGIPDIPVPRVLARERVNGREYLAVERMRGAMLPSFIGQPDELLRSFGAWLARVHRLETDVFGNPAGTRREAKEHFHGRLAEIVRVMVGREHPDDPEMREWLDVALDELSRLPAPEACCPVLVDLGPGQFLAEDGRITALVDVEAYVLAPRELDFVNLEYELDARAAEAFLEGYSSVLDVPDLSRCRTAYRLFCRLMGVKGSVDIRKWMAHPWLF
ncbi:MAG: aminoglycoside phosphotransferase [Thermobacillus sp. ZCTH02-B1]|uniref:phosphotransferase family protein n=1 Tax=Thermobacillus sp. ZCTH02-B1 TaxID=1858795 RepID=UPI000B56FE65|nr:aminoglycoside phosphotransferase family protein [Thermobacillus sp. ZCTH02-B1]OUM95290.1 MAG: aminoglycoside phosphotransferase [Thermobacillus sp. ZCTH02-B1]